MAKKLGRPKKVRPPKNPAAQELGRLSALKRNWPPEKYRELSRKRKNKV